MKTTDINISSFEDALSITIKDLVYNKEDIRKIFYAIQLCAEKLAKVKHYTILLSVDFESDFKVVLETTTTKPKSWDCNFIRDGLVRICEGLSSKDLLMSAITLRYNKRVIIELGEDPKVKATALDFKKPKAQKSEDHYVESN